MLPQVPVPISPTLTFSKTSPISLLRCGASSLAQFFCLKKVWLPARLAR